MRLSKWPTLLLLALAELLGMDPVQFRTINDTQVDPEKPERPFTQRQLIQCMQTGADQFGWGKRKTQPAQVPPLYPCSACKVRAARTDAPPA